MSDDEVFRNVIRAEFGPAPVARRGAVGLRRATAAMKLKDAISEFNAAERRELIAETGLTWLGDSGPVFRAGHVSIRGLFVDRSGGHWCDAGLVAESAYNSQPGALDYLLDRVGGDLEPAHELLLWTACRGRYTAFIAPVAAVVDLLELGPAEPSAEQWARCWETFPSATDRSEMEVLRHGLAVPGLTL